MRNQARFSELLTGSGDQFGTLSECGERLRAFFPLGKGEEVSVTDVFRTAPVTVKLTNSDKGESIVSIWPGDGEVRVEKDGVDVLDLIQKGVGV